MNEVVKNLLKYTSWPIVLAMIGLIVIGIAAITVSEQADVNMTGFAAKQWKFALLGMAVFVAMTLVPYHRFGPWSYALYGITFVSLVVILKMPAIRGSHRWFDVGPMLIQPSEIAKFTFIIMLAWYLRQGDHYRRIRGLIWPFVLTLVPMGLIVAEPDLGTSMLFLPTLYFMLYAAGAKLRHLLVILALGVAVIFVPVLMPVEDKFPQQRGQGLFTEWNLGPVTFFNVNQDVEWRHRPEVPVAYCRAQWGSGGVYDFQPLALRLMMGKTQTGQYAERAKRVAAWLRPDDPRLAQNEGYQARQGRLVLGSGGVNGRSDWNNTDSFFSVLPDDHTDFIFCVIGGQWGFIGCLVVLLLYGVIFVFGTEIAVITYDPFGRLLAVGVLALLFTQVVINVGMTLGLTPVTGMTLPWISYGGTSLIVNCAAMGLLVNVGQHRPVLLGKRPFEFGQSPDLVRERVEVRSSR